MTATDNRPVVVFDDDMQFLRMVERALKSHGLRAEFVTTPGLVDAADVVSAINPRLVIVDVFMYGDAAGFSFIEVLRSRAENRDLPIVVSSGAHSELARHREFLRQHRCSVLPKPFGVDDLLRAVDLAVAGEPADQESAVWCAIEGASETHAASAVLRVVRSAAQRIRPASTLASSRARHS